MDQFVLSVRRHPRPLKVAGLSVALAVAAWLMITGLPHATGRGLYTGYPQKLKADYATLQRTVKSFNDLQSNDDASLVSMTTLNGQLSQIQLEAASGDFITSETGIRTLQDQLATWSRELTTGGPNQLAATVNTSGLFVPIVIYHYTPDDFDAELTYLTNHNYTVVGLDAVAAALNYGASLPPKPVVITFDDGFEDQMKAFAILKAHHMKATFFIINGGQMSNWCIGAGRQYNLPSQPPGGCGDAYLTWDQIRALDKSGLITIGGHTLDHPDLPTLPVAVEQTEIAASKTQIEAEIGHPIYDFAYPYGDYDDTTIQLVRAAGYRDAVTTQAGDYQPAGSVYTLERIRTTIGLP